MIAANLPAQDFYRNHKAFKRRLRSKVDHVADSVRGVARAGAAVKVVGRPVAGFFIDEPNFNPAVPSYADDIRLV